MAIYLPGNHTPKAVYYGNIAIGKIYVGNNLVWPEAVDIGFRSVSICKTHAVFVLKDGSLWTCGSNTHGQLCRIVPSGNWAEPNLAKVEGIPLVKTAAASNTPTGEGSTVLLAENGRLYSAGYSSSSSITPTASVPRVYTSLGRASASGSPTFRNYAEVLGITQVRKLWHGRGRLFVMKNDNTYYGHGYDWNANRGLLQWMPLKDVNGETFNDVTEIHAQTDHFVLHRSSRDVSTTGPIAPWSKPSSLTVSQSASLQPYGYNQFWSSMKKVCTGLSHLVGITSDGYACVAGSDQYGQLITTRSEYRNPERGFVLNEYGPVADIAAGDNHTVIVLKNGRVLASGKNNCGQVGKPVPPGNGHDWLYYTGEDRTTDKEGWYGNLGEVPDIDDAIAVYAGGDGTVVVRESGVTVFGDNEFGQLGVATDCFVSNPQDRHEWKQVWQDIRKPYETCLKSVEELIP